MRDSPMKEINHSEYVCGTVHPNGVEFFWLMLKRAGRDVHLRALPRLASSSSLMRRGITNASSEECAESGYP
ncbi:MAG: hypothetical protein M2R45_00588 [Verrucomicrobia subdivision 3 bacterium]|nr:hypothetical protein [Limisphaerales bacterium]